MNNRMNSPDTMRIGIVEVGSRSIRLMVANFKPDGSFKADRTGSGMHRIDINQLDAGVITTLWSEVDKYYQELKRFNCDRVMVYGTALCRRIASLPGQQIPIYLHVLSPEEEAVASWAAGFICVRGENSDRRYTIIDQGGGSTEITTATWTGNTIEKVRYDSIEIGNERIMDIFSRAGATYAKTIHGLLEEYDDKIIRHKSVERSQVYLLGSVATKIAWLKVRKGIDDFYKPYLVNDVKLNVREIYDLHASILKIFRRDPEQARALIDARLSAEDEFARVMSGSVFLMMVALKLGYQEVSVSGYGVRHGMAFLARRGVI